MLTGPPPTTQRGDLVFNRHDGPTAAPVIVADIEFFRRSDRKSPMSRPLSLSRVREALKLNDREKLRQEFQETVPWILDMTPRVAKPLEDAAGVLKGRRHTDPGAAQ